MIHGNTTRATAGPEAIGQSGAGCTASARLRLLVLAPNSWHGQWVNRQQLFSRIGLLHPVLYSTGGWFTWDRYTSAWSRAGWAGSFQRHDNVWIDESPRILMRVPRVRVLDELVLQAQVYRWKRFMRATANDPLVAYVYHPKFFPYVKTIAADYVVYHAYDMYEHTAGWNEELERRERELLRTADMVIASSEQIAADLQGKILREVKVLPNGADVAAFARALCAGSPVPEDLQAIPRPRLGYIGTINLKVDWDLIASLASRRLDWHFVFVGQVISIDAKSEAKRAACAALPNVHFLGEKAVDQVPLYVTNMDVNLMCYLESDELWTAWGYPLKLHEYLAAGRPVVSSGLPSVRPFGDVVYIASGTDDWQNAIEDALLRGGRGTLESRRTVAANNSWDDRVVKLQQWLIDLTATEREATRKG
jgi:glycosyltransferase involved in cell wall biosynthesis